MVKKICNFLSTIVLIMMLIVAALLIIPPIMGYQSFSVLSGSMEPKISVGSIVYAKEADPQDLEVGDIVTYRLNGDTMVTHRIIEIDAENQTLITQGDANDVADSSPVAYTQIVGRVKFYVPLLGYISMYIKTPLGIAAVCGVLFVMILLSLLSELFSKDSEKKEAV